MSPLEWYYAREGQLFGPLGAEQLRQLADAGQLSPDDLVWQEGMKRWFPARLVKGLFGQRATEAGAASEVAAGAEPPPNAVIALAEAPETGGNPVARGSPPADAVDVAAANLPGSAEESLAEESAEGDEDGADSEVQPAFEQSAAVYQRSREGGRRHAMDYFLDLGRSLFRDAYADSAAELFSLVGHYGLYAVMFLWLIVHAALATRQKSFDTVLWALGEIAFLAILQYCGQRFMRTMGRMQRTVTAHVSSLTLLDFLALVSFLIGLSALIGLTVNGVRSSGYWDVLRAMGIFIACQYMAILALNPHALNVTLTAPSSPGGEAIGIGWFLLRCAAKTVPIVYGLGVAWGAARLIFALYLLVSPPTESGPWTADLNAVVVHTVRPVGHAQPLDELLRIVPAQATATAAGTVIFAAAAAPLLMFAVYVLGQWLLEVARALLPDARTSRRDEDL